MVQYLKDLTENRYFPTYNDECTQTIPFTVPSTCNVYEYTHIKILVINFNQENEDLCSENSR